MVAWLRVEVEQTSDVEMDNWIGDDMDGDGNQDRGEKNEKNEKSIVEM